MTEPFSTERRQLSAFRERIDQRLAEILPPAGDPPNRLHTAMRQAVLSPGKRIRPVLALLTAAHLGSSPWAALPGACALELVHAASLVLDDLPSMDNSPVRRGEPSVHARHGEAVAVLVAVALLNEAFAVLSQADELPEPVRLKMIAVLTRAVGTNGLVAGQEKDLETPLEPSLNFFNQLHHEKTAVLFIAAVEMGALASEAAPPEREALRTFAAELGLAFQALDDLADEPWDAPSRPGKLGVLGPERLRTEADLRLENARLALMRGGPQIVPLGGYLELLLGRAA